MSILDWVMWAAVLALVLQVWPLWYGALRRRALIDMAPLAPDDPTAPLVSIIVPARDEAAAVEEGLRSLLSLDYPRYEVIAIDDRSTDGTGEIMDRVAAGNARCRVLHLTELPPGWLGKNHANMQGARLARGEYLLFTDGDVVFRPPILRHALKFMQGRGLDHLALFPETPAANFWQSLLMNHFVVLFAILTRYPLARIRRLRFAYVGIGAFNLVRRSAYLAVGTHERLRLEVADDLILGKLLKQAGFAQDVLDGRPLAWVRWQTGLRGMIGGLEKNAFAGTRYSLVVATLGVLSQLLLAVVPPLLIILGPARLPAAVLCAIMVGNAALTTRITRSSLLVPPFYAVAQVLFAYIIARSTYVTLRDRGVTWRGTFYPLAELRKSMV